MSSSPRLSPVDWTDAALEAMAETGTAGVNVEQLARQLGATKGSFYHHFENRQALLVAALARWEDIVDDDLTASSQIEDPVARVIAGSVAAVETNVDGFVDLALASSVGDPIVEAALMRVNEQRLRWLSNALAQAGFGAEEARSRAVRGLSAYLGMYQLQRTLGETFDRDEVAAQITTIVETMFA